MYIVTSDMIGKSDLSLPRWEENSAESQPESFIQMYLVLRRSKVLQFFLLIIVPGSISSSRSSNSSSSSSFPYKSSKLNSTYWGYR